jgi:hypothetical protein
MRKKITGNEEIMFQHLCIVRVSLLGVCTPQHWYWLCSLRLGLCNGTAKQIFPLRSHISLSTHPAFLTGSLHGLRPLPGPSRIPSQSLGFVGLHLDFTLLSGPLKGRFFSFLSPDQALVWIPYGAFIVALTISLFLDSRWPFLPSLILLLATHFPTT